VLALPASTAIRSRAAAKTSKTPRLASNLAPKAMSAILKPIAAAKLPALTLALIMQLFLILVAPAPQLSSLLVSLRSSCWQE